MKKTFSYEGYSVRIEGPVRGARQDTVLRAMSVTKSPKEAKQCPCSKGVGIKDLWVLLDAKSTPVPPDNYAKERARLLRLARQRVSQLETKLKAAIDEHLRQGHKS